MKNTSHAYSLDPKSVLALCLSGVLEPGFAKPSKPARTKPETKKQVGHPPFLSPHALAHRGARKTGSSWSTHRRTRLM